jgi:hypothetical protein
MVGVTLMNSVDPIATFRTAVAGARFIVCLSAAMDAFDPDEPYSRVFFLDERERGPEVWTFDEYDFVIPSVCVWNEPKSTTGRIFVALSEDGEVVFMGPNEFQERIPDAGLDRRFAKGYGYVSDIHQIGTRLYACGFSGQVYRRDGRDNWVHMDEGLLQPPTLAEGEFGAQVIRGPKESAIYVAGFENLKGHPPRADFWNGRKWNRLTLPPTSGRITDIYVESDERVWMCGDNGTLLLGNAVEGFKTMNPLGGTQLFTSITKYGDIVYLASNVGLFQFDPAQKGRRFQKVRTRLKPDIADANVVSAVDDVLWSIGGKDVARFDGKKWERFNHPDNPPIGVAEAVVER